MKYKLTLNISCQNAGKCADDIKKKVTDLLETDDPNQFHISIFHERTKHQIWIFTYDKAKKNESEAQGKTIIQHDENIKKFTGKKPTLDQLKKVLNP
jgi:hypothetical protein